MKLYIIAALAFVAAATAAPTDRLDRPLAPQAPQPQLKSQTYEIDPVGNYEFGFEIDNGNQRSEVGRLATIVDDEKQSHDVIVAEGSYYLFDADNKPHLVRFRADENGFHVESDLIPKDNQPSIQPASN